MTYLPRVHFPPRQPLRSTNIPGAMNSRSTSHWSGFRGDYFWFFEFEGRSVSDVTAAAYTGGVTGRCLHHISRNRRLLYNAVVHGGRGEWKEEQKNDRG